MKTNKKINWRAEFPQGLEEFTEKKKYASFLTAVKEDNSLLKGHEADLVELIADVASTDDLKEYLSKNLCKTSLLLGTPVMQEWFKANASVETDCWLAEKLQPALKHILKGQMGCATCNAFLLEVMPSLKDFYPLTISQVWAEIHIKNKTSKRHPSHREYLEDLYGRMISF
ncbi:MAG: hypothetical protein E7012_00670 [Alphaproteobacteria bacterium]|nr:hypothetical protein [Alphaproteobacteria bacterium]